MPSRSEAAIGLPKQVKVSLVIPTLQAPFYAHRARANVTEEQVARRAAGTLQKSHLKSTSFSPCERAGSLRAFRK